MFVRSHSIIFLPSFMFVGATVSEIRELNQNKKEENEKKFLKTALFKFNTFPTCIIEPFFNQLLLDQMYMSNWLVV